MSTNSKTLVSLDYAIKYLLKDKGDYEIIEGFISAILKDAGYLPVKITALLESESNKERKDLKKSVADVIVEDQQGHKYIVEIDRSTTHTFLHKACFNSCRLIVDNISSDQDYSDIKKIFHINLIYFVLSDISSPLYHGQTIFRKMDREHPVDLHLADMGCRFFDVHNVFPEYFVISVPLFDGIIKDELDEWLYFAKHSEVKDDFKSPYMKKVAERLSVLKMTPEERQHYQNYVNESLKERDYIVAARTEGRAEEKIAMAKKMLKENFSIETISRIIELSIEEIEVLRENLAEDTTTVLDEN
ncbi:MULTISPECIES: Rpn family recombination-promoting nuclease/putative transposase [unclassified Candidatus Tisiphia]|jgi:predicted transposase/invertase (TIGR01784 family)|uniref:Rpn family recombination-promoting nuclease/putative transposase n=1 Tax=unclassified Candidatus Tisiphia TaxID=2996318 RepID=UPI001E76FB0B|nr:MAG: Rpn family recombination-promoting nuclease/putative transposase [Rickettsia endosymbiont of Cimex lectularius]